MDFSHDGGTTPFLFSRFIAEEKTMKDRETRLPKGLIYEFRKFYYDLAQANHSGALAALLQLVPATQVPYGTRFPLRSGGEVNAGIAARHFMPATWK